MDSETNFLYRHLIHLNGDKNLWLDTHAWYICKSIQFLNNNFAQVGIKASVEGHWESGQTSC